jgi:hypothetical protein
MTIKDKILEELDENESIMFVDGFDEAIIGINHSTEKRIVYSFCKGLEILKNKMSEEEALKHLYYNVMMDDSKYPIWVMDYHGKKDLKQ